MAYTVKKLGSKDLQLAKDLFYLFQMDPVHASPSLPSEEYLINLLERDDFHVFAAIREEMVIGGLTAYELNLYCEEERAILIYEIGVGHEHRKSGVATDIVKQLKKYCKTAGIEKMYAGALTDNAAARELFSATGGEPLQAEWFAFRIE